MERIIFEIGGTNIRVGRVENGAPTAIKKEATPPRPQDAVEVLARMIRQAAGRDGVEIVAGGIPGIISPGGLVHRSPNLPAWDGFAFGAALSERVNAPCIFRNDADIGGLGEALHGAGRGYDIVAFLVNGTGVGGSRIVRGVIDEQAYGFEPGQYLLDPQTGKTFEQLVSGRAIKEKYHLHPRELSNEIWEGLTPTLAVGLYTAILFWSPDVLVLGGAMFRDEQAFQLESIERELSRLNTMFPELPAIHRGELGDDAGLWGAVSLLERT